MPIANIPSVMEHGILSHNARLAKRIQCHSVAMDLIQERRDNISIPGGMALHEYANLYFDARNPMMFRLKSDNRHTEICVLVLNKDILLLPDVVLSDKNASSTYARFIEPRDIAMLRFDKIYAEDWRHPDNQAAYFEHRSLKCAEVLVPHSVPFEFIASACVVNEQCKQELIDAKFTLPIDVTPNLFFC